MLELFLSVFCAGSGYLIVMVLINFFDYLTMKDDEKPVAIDYNHKDRVALASSDAYALIHSVKQRIVEDEAKTKENLAYQKEDVPYYAQGIEPVVPQLPVRVVDGYELVGYHDSEGAALDAQRRDAAVWRGLLPST